MTITSDKVLLPAIKTSVYINATPERVYETLTTGKGWNAWFTQGSQVDAHVGGKVSLIWKNWGTNNVDVEDGGPVLEALPNKRFSFRWHGKRNPTTVTFDLEKRGSGTVLNLSDSGYQSDDMTTDCGFLDCAIGWGEALTLLKFYLEHGVIYGEVPKKAGALL